MKSRIITGCFLLLLVAPLRAQTPVPVVERVFTEGEVATRLTLFSNRVVVVTISENGVQGFFRRHTLPNEQYMIYLSILQTAAEELGEKPVTSAVSTSRSELVLTLHLGPEAPREIRFSPMATVSLPLARITGAVNDLEGLVREASPSAENLRTWEPRRGDRVELMNGTFARVDEVLDQGLIILEYENTHIRQYIAADGRDEVILRVVDQHE